MRDPKLRDFVEEHPQAVADARAFAADSTNFDPNLFAVINEAGEVLWRPLVDAREMVEGGGFQWVTETKGGAPLRRGQPGPRGRRSQQKGAA
jgi:hypothetical protein